MHFPEQTLPIRNERVISSNLISGSLSWIGRLKVRRRGVWGREDRRWGRGA
jgi:hypothetical protein